MPLAWTKSSSSVKEKRNYKEVQELLLLHKRYEEKAVRLFRKGLSDTSRAEETRDRKRRSCAQSAADLNAFDNGSTKARVCRKKYSPNLHHKDSHKPHYLNDKDYLKQILLKSDDNLNFPDRSVAQIHWEDTTTRAQLRLPKLDSIPPENKEIFYTTLPKMPPLPKLKDTKAETVKSHRKKKRNRHNSCNETNTFSSETCLTVRQLPRDHFMLHDFGNGTSSSSTISTASSFPRITAQREMDITSKAITSEEGRLWLVPIVNIEIPPYRLAKWNEVENGNSSAEEDKLKTLQIKGVRSDNRTVEDSHPKYKRNVHFSEFLHEIHLYSPISTAQSARSRDVNNINNE